MILTVTMNVAIDKLYIVDNLTPGEVIRVKKCNYTAGGKGLNVSRVAKILGEDVIATGFIGGYAGDYVEDQLKTNNIKTDFVRVSGESRSCINIIDSKTRVQTELLEPGVEVSKKDICKFIEKYIKLASKSDIIAISGSVPKGVGESLYPELIKISKEKGKKVILDTSGKLLKAGIKACPTMIKPNKDELQSLLGIKVSDYKSAIEAAKKLYNSGIEMVVVSLGKDGAILVCDEGVFHSKPPKINAVNTVGCGDSMVAAFATGFLRGYSKEETLRFAVAVSSASALTIETGSFCPESMKKILERVEIKSL